MKFKEFKELLEENRLWNHIFDSYGRKENESRGFCGAVYSESGESGGDCWGGQPSHFYRTVKSEPFLEKIVELVCPNISFLNFRKLEELKQDGSYAEGGYYGNYSTTYYQWVDLTSLFEKLQEMNVNG